MAPTGPGEVEVTRTGTVVWIVVVSFIALAAPASRANAQQANATIVFEWFEARKPERADVVMGMLRQELDKLGFVASPPEVKRRLGNQLALPASEPPPADASAPSAARTRGRSTVKKTQPPNPRSSGAVLLKELTNVHERWIAAKESFDTLEPALLKAVRNAFASPALIVADQAIRNKLQSVLLDLALIDGKLAHPQIEDGDTEEVRNQKILLARQYQKFAEDWMAEWIRTYGSEGITQKKHGPDADELYTRVREERDKLGRGTLSITVDDPNVLLYVNETIRSLRHPITDLSPGVYRGLMMGTNDDARLFRLEVLPNQTTRLAVDWSVSSSLVISEWSIAFIPTSSMPPDPAVLGTKLARVTGSSGVLLIGMEMKEKAWVATASLYNVTSGQTIRSGYTALGAEDTQKRLAALALFLAKGTHDPDVVVTTDSAPSIGDLTAPQLAEPSMPSVMPRDRATPPARSRRVGKWLVAGGSATMLALGGYSLYLHYTCGNEQNSDCKYVYTRAGVVGYAETLAGVTLGVVAAYLFLADSRLSAASKVAVAPSPTGAMVYWTTGF
jgi:hypothetical protein